MASGESFTEMINNFSTKKILILGDVMIDAYLWGKVDRISPEAPVPVVALNKRENRPGGAANVALNLQALGAQPLLCSVIGNDRQGEVFTDLLEQAGIDPSWIVKSPDRITTTKFRIIGNNAQMLRVDEEHVHDLTPDEEEIFLQKISGLINYQQVDAIIFQDYNKGILTPEVISRVISMALEKNIPTCVDPKKKNFTAYRDVTLFKPNVKELKEGLKLDFDQNDRAKLENAANFLVADQNIRMLLVTLSDEGVMICHRKEGKQETRFISAHHRSISDVSGAGDTVISVAALCLTRDCDPFRLAALSNLAGGLVCEEVGVVPVSLGRLLKESALLDEIG
ncbi:MAG: bifunctional ADP-heptose synthase [Bacteroidetes bacterium]|nr:bifunctional ADP-heptose synthase [Bacteroidota bacterium]